MRTRILLYPILKCGSPVYTMLVTFSGDDLKIVMLRAFKNY